MGKQDRASRSGKLIMGSAIGCVASILFALVVLVLGAWQGEEDDVPEVYVVMAGGACVAFTLSALFGLVCWFVKATSGD